MLLPQNLDQLFVTVDEIGKLTGIDLFPGLNNDLGNRLERNINKNCLNF